MRKSGKQSFAWVIIDKKKPPDDPAGEQDANILLLRNALFENNPRGLLRTTRVARLSYSKPMTALDPFFSSRNPVCRLSQCPPYASSTRWLPSSSLLQTLSRYRSRSPI